MTDRTPALLVLMRPHDWSKNLFVVAPLFFSLKLFDSDSLGNVLLAFVIFCLASSAVYALNDIFDAESDRLHPEKRNRPIAAGRVGVPGALALSFFLLICGATILVYSGLGQRFALVVGAYIVINVAYSVAVKRVQLVEMFFVAAGYVLRIIAGSLAIDRVPSEWILVCAGVLSLFLVVGKRRDDIARNASYCETRPPFKHYTLVWLDKLLVLLGTATILTYTLFTVSDYAQTRFNTPYLLLTSAFVAVWVFRYMQIVVDGEGAYAPSILVVRDKMLLTSVVGWGATFFLIMYL